MIDVQQLSHSFPAADGQLQVLDQVDLKIRRHEFVALLGPSGCGKTTLLKIIAGLEPWLSGKVRVQDQVVSGPGNGRAVVFQNFALLPWANVLTNAAFGLELRGMAKDEREARAAELLEQVGLKGFEDYFPGQLSGGMQQRVGLARALAVEPDILLMDEPFSALDAQTRRLMQEDLLDLLTITPKTVLYVTHSMEEAVRLADRILLMGPRPGRIIEAFEVPFGRPRAVDIETDPRFTALIAQIWSKLREMQPRHPH